MAVTRSMSKWSVGKIKRELRIRAERSDDAYQSNKLASPFRFLDLPIEIRLMVYELLMIPDDCGAYDISYDYYLEGNWWGEKGWTPFSIPPALDYLALTETCRMIHREALPLYFRRFELHVWIYCAQPEALQLVPVLALKLPIQMVTRLSISYNLTDDLVAGLETFSALMSTLPSLEEISVCFMMDLYVARTQEITEDLVSEFCDRWQTSINSPLWITIDVDGGFRGYPYVCLDFLAMVRNAETARHETGCPNH